MSRPLFFTGRRQIARSDVSVRLIDAGASPSKFELSVDLKRYGLPPDAAVIAEAYHKLYLERFQLGPVEKLETRIVRELGPLATGDRLLFRLKVVESNGAGTGRLLAAADEIRLKTEDEGADAGSLLPIVPMPREQMGDQLWQLRFAEGEERSPELWVNRDAQNLYVSLQVQDSKLLALIMPEVLRQVLRGMVGDGDEWTDEGCLGKWLELSQHFYPDKFDEWDNSDWKGSQKNRYEWVDQVVDAFTRAHNFFDKYQELREQTDLED